MAEPDDLSQASAFDHAYREHGPRVRNFLRLFLGNAAAADDLTQETFLHLWKQPASFDARRGAIKSYLLGIARKKAADWWRHNKSDPAAAAEQAYAASNASAVTDALNRLPEELRTVLWLREVEGYSYRELAEILKIPVGTVRSRLHASRKQLRTIWTKEAP